MKRKTVLILSLVLALALLTGCGGEKEAPEEKKPPRPAIAVSVEEARAALEAYDANLLFLRENGAAPGRAGTIAEFCFRYYLAGMLPSPEITELSLEPYDESRAYLVARLGDGSELWFLFGGSGLNLAYLGGVGENGVLLYGNSGEALYRNTEYDGPVEYPFF